MKNETLKRSQVRKIAKQYGFTIDDFIPWYGSHECFHTFFSKGDFQWNEEDWFETEEHAHRYFKAWSEDERAKAQ